MDGKIKTNYMKVNWCVQNRIILFLLKFTFSVHDIIAVLLDRLKLYTCIQIVHISEYIHKLLAMSLSFIIYRKDFLASTMKIHLCARS